MDACMNRLSTLFLSLAMATSLGCSDDDPSTTADASMNDGSAQASPCPASQPSDGAECSGRYTQDDVTPYESQGVLLSCGYAYEDCPGAGFDYQVECGCRDDGTWYCVPYRCHFEFDAGSTSDAKADSSATDAGTDATMDAN